MRAIVPVLFLSLPVLIPAVAGQRIPAAARRLLSSSDAFKCCQGLSQIQELEGKAADRIILDKAARSRNLKIRDHALEVLRRRRFPGTVQWHDKVETFGS